MHQLVGNTAVAAAQHLHRVAANKPQATQNKGRLSHAKQTAQHFPKRVAADMICLSTVVKMRTQHSRRTGTDSQPAMVEANLSSERLCFPPVHSSGCHCDPVNRATFHWFVTTDLAKATVPKQLTASTDMFELSEHVRIGVPPKSLMIFDKGRTCDAKLRIPLELPKEKFEVILLKGNVCIQISDNVKLKRGLAMSEVSITGIEGMGFGSELAVATLGHAKKFDPIMISGIALDNFVRTIVRTVAHNDPFSRQNRLFNDRANRLFD